MRRWGTHSIRVCALPSPIGHSILAFTIHRVAVRANGTDYWWSLVLYVFAANAADLDFLPGLLVGEPSRYHHGVSHSIGFAVLFALGGSLALALLRKEPLGWNFGVLFLLYFSHVGLDYFSTDTTLPYGVPMYWPLSGAYYIAPFAFLPGIRRAETSAEFIPSLFSMHNLWAASVECLLLLPLLLLLVKVRRQTRVVPG